MTPHSVDPAVRPEGTMSPVSVASASSVPSLQPSASYSITMRVRQRQLPRAFARVAGAIGETGAILGAIDLVRAEGGCGRARRRVWAACCVRSSRAQDGTETGGVRDGQPGASACSAPPKWILRAASGDVQVGLRRDLPEIDELWSRPARRGSVCESSSRIACPTRGRSARALRALRPRWRQCRSERVRLPMTGTACAIAPFFGDCEGLTCVQRRELGVCGSVKRWAQPRTSLSV
jgi:hypothetical protein